ncbi:MAG: cytochrome c oxidase subunit II [Nocardioidaceae bacterium]
MTAQSPERTRWWQTPDARSVFVLWAVFTVLGVVLAVTVPQALMGQGASDSMDEVEKTFTVFSVASAPVAALVWALGVHSLVRWRRKGDWTPGDPDGPALRGNGWATGAWIFGSVALCLFLLVWGLAALSAVSAPATAANPLVVKVTGQQWVWSFSYPQNGGVETSQLYLPVNRPVVFHVSSDDVIHSFWVDEMGIKVDANPGMTTTTQTIPNRIGVYHVRCAELCGLLHADMQTNAHVVSDQAFTSWLRAHGGS